MNKRIIGMPMALHAADGRALHGVERRVQPIDHRVRAKLLVVCAALIV